jgi:Na+/H+ antiporter NhaD/arsenite permease-like protein
MLDHHISFSQLWALPFIGFLASLALVPIFSATFWHRYYRIISIGWIASFLIPLLMFESIQETTSLFLSALVHHYIPFMVLITALFTIGGGIHVTMKGKASPLLNAWILGFGAIISNIVGTMGASMLLIRPIISLNKYRRDTIHVIIFFIFLVSNIGGVLTPLGDPPLFIGFLNDVDFFWTTINLFNPFLIVVSALLIIFFIIDHYYFYRDRYIPDPSQIHGEAKIQIKGMRNFLYLCVAIATIIIESMVRSKLHIHISGLTLSITSLTRDLILVCIIIASWKFTPSDIHKLNHFSWEPIKEVAFIFLGIFITVIPVLSMLKAGESGPLGVLLQFANSDQLSRAQVYFWLTGIFSAFLDNAPTYLIFFNMAGMDAYQLMHENAATLAAISLGSVFMGAMTYIGNAPNFVVRSIAIHAHVKMPSFFGYILWSLGILFPVFLIFSWFWFT